MSHSDGLRLRLIFVSVRIKREFPTSRTRNRTGTVMYGLCDTETTWDKSSGISKEDMGSQGLRGRSPLVKILRAI